MLDRTDLQKEIFDRLAIPVDEREAMADMLDTAVNVALDEVSRVAPTIAYLELTIPARTDQIPVTDPEVVNVIDLWIPYPSSPAVSLGFEPEYAGMRVFHSPSLMHILEHKWEQWNARYGFDWEFDPDARIIRLIPPMRTETKAVYKATKPRTLDSIPPKYAKPFKDLVLAEMYEIRVNSLGSGAITSVPIGIGSVTFQPGAMLERAKELRKSALQKFGYAGSAVVIG